MSTSLFPNLEIQRDAAISPCGKYRWSLDLLRKAIAYGFSRVAYERMRSTEGVLPGFALSPYSILLQAGAVGSVEAGE